VPQVQLDVCLLSLDPAYWDRQDAVAWADLSPKACDGKPKMLSAAEASRFCQSMRAMKVGQMLAEPRLVTYSGRPGTFLSGGQVRRVTGVTMVGRPDGTTRPDFQSDFTPFGCEIKFLPIVSPDGIRVDCE